MEPLETETLENSLTTVGFIQETKSDNDC